MKTAMEIYRKGRRYLRFWPHGYEYPIELPVITSGVREGTGAWTWNGSLENPTLRPSIRTDHGGSGIVSHLWLNDGNCQYLDDSTDGFAGQKLPLRNLGWQCDMGDEGFDHDWTDKRESYGELDGAAGNEWAFRECRVCGTQEDPTPDTQNPQ
jgi:hypothetical protein